MTDNYINFRMQRDLGEIISDTFKFLRENYKLLYKLIFKIAGPALAILVLTLGFFYAQGGGTTFISGDLNVDDPWKIFLTIFLMLVSFLVFFALFQGITLHFVRSYIENRGTVIEKDVTSGVKEDLGSLLGISIIVPILLFFGLMLCVLPGIYLWIPLSLTVPVIVFGRTGAIDSIGAAFNLIKDNWWMTFLSLVVIFLLMYFIALIFQIPMFIYIFIKMFTVAQEGSAANPEAFFDWVYVVLSVISSIAQYLLYTILVIATAFIYYHLDEKKNFTGTYETISNLGSSEEKI